MTTATGLVGTSGLTIRALVWNRSRQVWNGSAYVTFSAADWASYVVTATEYGATGVYSASVPSGAQSDATLVTFHQGATQSVALAFDGTGDADIRKVSGTNVGGVGTAATPWGPA